MSQSDPDRTLERSMWQNDTEPVWVGSLAPSHAPAGRQKLLYVMEGTVRLEFRGARETD
jgi:hypothetical protein